MTNIILNQNTIPVDYYRQKSQNGLIHIEIDFKVTSEDYHKITTLLYEGVFDVKVPELGIEFRGAIQKYYTSVNNLYHKDEVGNYHISLLEVNNDKMRIHE